MFNGLLHNAQDFLKQDLVSFDAYCLTVQLEDSQAMEVFFYISNLNEKVYYEDLRNGKTRFWFGSPEARKNFTDFVAGVEPNQLPEGALWPSQADMDRLLDEGETISLKASLRAGEYGLQIKYDEVYSTAAFLLYSYTRTCEGRVFYWNQRFRFENAADYNMMVEYIEANQEMLQELSRRRCSLITTGRRTRQLPEEAHERRRQMRELFKDGNLYSEKDIWKIAGEDEIEPDRRILQDAARNLLADNTRRR